LADGSPEGPGWPAMPGGMPAVSPGWTDGPGWLVIPGAVGWPANPVGIPGWPG
jgi:hypothetical protein